MTQVPIIIEIAGEPISRLFRNLDEARHSAPLSRTNSGAGLIAVEVFIENAGEPDQIAKLIGNFLLLSSS